MDPKPKRAQSRMWRVALPKFDTVVAAGEGVRMLRADDALKLGTLFFTAFKGTTDDLGQTEVDYIEEAYSLFDGRYGDCLFDASSVIEREGELLSVCVVTDHELYDCPVIVMVATLPSMQGNGMASGLVKTALANLVVAGYDTCCAMVTAGNTPSEGLFAHCGFVPLSVER